MESLLFVSLAPLAFLLMGVVVVVAWQRRDVPGARSLAAFTATAAGWLAFDALALLAPTPEATLRLVEFTSMFGPLLCVSWLAFVLTYTEHFPRSARLAVGALAAWAPVYGLLACTNEGHRLVWASWKVVPEGALSRVTYTLGPLGWAQTGFAWAAIAVSLGVLLWVYAGTGRRARRLSWWIVAGALVPMAVNVGFLLGVGPLEKDFTPIGMAVSAAAFALGLARYQFLDLRPIARAALVDDLREGMLVLDAQDRVVDVNPAFCRALGVSASAVGRPLHATAPALADAIDAGRDAPFRIDVRGSVRYFDLRISPLADRSGARTGRLVLLHDVTVRRREQAALRRANAGLHDANTDLYHANAELKARNEELDAFAHTVAHDLKNSIQGVLGWAEILRDDGPDLSPPTHRAIADDVVDAAQKMGTVVHELLLLARVRKEAVAPRPLDMSAIVRAAQRRPRQPTLAAPLPSRWPAALGHAPWVEEIWANYLSNAAKYGGPRVTLGAETTASGQARFWVHDDGPGLAPEQQARLFVPFSRVGSLDVDGHGLGLSIVRRIVERLDGTCGVESTPGWGTRFWFALPAAPAASTPTVDAGALATA